MSDEERQYRRRRSEKPEKEEEKQEKSWDEKWRRDPLSAGVWALILIWAGLTLLAGNLGLFDGIEQIEGWDLFFAGAGLILVGEVALRLLVPAYRGPVIGTTIIAAVFLGIGLGGLLNWGIVWGLVIIAFGAYVLFRGLRRGQE